MDGLFLSPLKYAQIERETENHYRRDQASRLLGGSMPTLFGVSVSKAATLPAFIHCDDCSGTGEGSSSTYCEHCRGEGSTKVVGLGSVNGKFTRLTERQGKAFEPHWPSSIAVPLRELPRRTSIAVDSYARVKHRQDRLSCQVTKPPAPAYGPASRRDAMGGASES